MQSTVSERLREYLFISKKNVKQLAGEINVSQASLNNVVNGKNLPSSNLLIRLATTKGISINWVLLGEGNMMRHEEEGTPTKQHLPLDKVESFLTQFRIAANENNAIWKRLIDEKDEHLSSKDRLIESKDTIIDLLRSVTS
ncbi:MAG: helix-turn-helix transcriptional regulator [Aureispira sp.]